MKCNQDCNQGRSCNCYAQHFDHLGNPVDLSPPWTVSDLLILTLCVLCIVGLMSGFFK